MAEETYSLLPLLKKISANLPTVTPDEITEAITRVSLKQCSEVQTGALLTAMHYTGLDMRADVITGATKAMRRAGLQIPNLRLPPLDAREKHGEGSYEGGLVDIVGTGGDGHDTYNVSTTAAIVAAGCGIRICKHGAKASTSSSGGADLLTALGASLVSVTPAVVSALYAALPASPASSFCFLFAPVFHPAMAHIAPIRRELGCRTIFNVLGPLLNPADYSQYPAGGLEARVLGVGSKELGPVYAQVLGLLGIAKKALVVCGAEQLDEISPEGYTDCWQIVPGTADQIRHFRMHPTETFGLDTHPLGGVAGGKRPEENAQILRRLLAGEMPVGDPIMDFVLCNTAALVAVAGAVGGDSQVGADGVIRGSLWTNAVERAKEAIASGESWRCWNRFLQVTAEAKAAAGV